VVIGGRPLFERKLNRKAKAVGKPFLAGFTLDFSIPLNAVTASNPANYQVDTVRAKRVKKKVEEIVHPITNFTVSYGPESDTVTITFTRKVTFPTGGQITVLGGVVSASGGQLRGPTQLTIAPDGRRIEPG
jgi:hypothetical protein